MPAYNKEQQESADLMHCTFHSFMATLQALKFMEEKFGIVNIHVITFRKEVVQKAQEKHEQAQALFNETGAAEVCRNSIEELTKKANDLL